MNLIYAFFIISLKIVNLMAATYIGTNYFKIQNLLPILLSNSITHNHKVQRSKGR